MDKFQIFRAGIERFTGAGYLYIGMDHFARPGDELCIAQKNRTLHRNFQGYTTKAGADLLGLGVSSISGIDRTYAQNRRDLKEYYAAIERHELPIMRGIGLSDDDVIRRAVISRLLCHCVLHKEEVESEFGIRFDEYFADELARLESLQTDGLVTSEPRKHLGDAARTHFHPECGNGVRQVSAEAEGQAGVFEDALVRVRQETEDRIRSRDRGRISVSEHLLYSSDSDSVSDSDATRSPYSRFILKLKQANS